MVMKIAVLPGDGIGSEIVAEAVKVLQGEFILPSCSHVLSGRNQDNTSD